MKISALVLAAGQSTRMGRNKLLLPWNGCTVIRQVVEVVSQCAVDDVFVVTGFDADSIEKALKGLPCRIVYNHNYELGMASSIAAGISEVSRDAEAIMIALGDMPFITVELVAQVISAGSPDEIVVPRKADRLGQPILFGSKFKLDLMNLEGDRGAKLLLAERSESVVFVEVTEEQLFEDVDTAEQYQACQRAAKFKKRDL